MPKPGAKEFLVVTYSHSGPSLVPLQRRVSKILGATTICQAYWFINPRFFRRHLLYLLYYKSGLKAGIIINLKINTLLTYENNCGRMSKIGATNIWNG